MRSLTPPGTPFSDRIWLSRVGPALAAIVLTTALASNLSAQTRPGGDDPNRRRGGEQGADAGGRRGGGSPEEMQARMLASLRERFEVTDDEEWKLISERLTKLTELRRNAAGAGGLGGFAGRGPGGPGGPGGDRGGPAAGRGGRGTGGGSTELAALSGAVRDKLPDAEIKSRLERLREVRKDNEAKLAKAQEEFRAVLSVRQEAIAVVFGLLP